MGVNREKVTLNIDPEVVKKAKHKALDMNKSLSDIVEELLKKFLGIGQ